MNIFSKRNLFLFISVLMFAVVGMFCVSCGDDDEENPTISGSSTFAGFWTIPNIYETTKNNKDVYVELHLLMYPDGHLVYYTTDITSLKTGTWSYNSNLNILVTDILLGDRNLQWEITATNPNFWSGLGLWNDKNLANTTQKGNAEDFARIILEKLTWENVDKSSRVKSLRIRWTSNRYTSGKLVVSSRTSSIDVHGNDQLWGWSEHCAAGNGNDHTFFATLSNDNKILSLVDQKAKAKITISDPLSYDSRVMKMAVEFDNFIINYNEGEWNDYFNNYVYTPIWGAFKGDFIVSK